MRMAMGMIGLMLDLDFCRPKVVALDLFAGQPNIREAERIDARLNRRQLEPAIGKRPEGHIATDAAETVEVGYLHRRRGQVFSCTTVTLVVIPPRGVKAATSFMRRGCNTATRSSRMRLVTFS